MEFNWLKDFETLAACRNFSRAAEERHVSQPAFSRRIRALENAVGVELINRETLPLSLTAAGQEFLGQARVMLQMLDETLERCQAIDLAGERMVRIAASQSLFTTYYQTMIAPLGMPETLSVDLNSASWPAEKFVSSLQQGYCDIILAYWHPAMQYLGPLEMTQFDHLTIARDTFVPVTKAGPDGAPQHVLGIAEKARLPLLSYGSASAFRPLLDDILRSHIAAPNTLVISQSALSNSVKAMIQEGFGLGWLPQRLCQEELDQGQLVLAGDAGFAAPLEVRVYRRRENAKPPLEALWQKMQELALS